MVTMRRMLAVLLALCIPLAIGTASPAGIIVDDDSVQPKQAAAAVSCATITVTAMGTVSEYNIVGITGETIPAVPVSNGDALVVSVAGNDPNFGNDMVTLQWNGLDFAQVAGTGGNGPGFGLFSWCDIWILTGLSSGTHDIILTFNVDGPQAVAMTAYRVSGLKNDANEANVLDQHGYSVASASGSALATLGGTTAQGCELLVGAIATEGPSTDTAGSWGNSFTGVQRVGTTGGASPFLNITLADGYRVVTSTGLYATSKTGMTARDNIAVIGSLKQ